MLNEFNGDNAWGVGYDRADAPAVHDSFALYLDCKKVSQWNIGDYEQGRDRSKLIGIQDLPLGRHTLLVEILAAERRDLQADYDARAEEYYDGCAETLRSIGRAYDIEKDCEYDLPRPETPDGPPYARFSINIDPAAPGAGAFIKRVLLSDGTALEPGQSSPPNITHLPREDDSDIALLETSTFQTYKYHGGNPFTSGRMEEGSWVLLIIDVVPSSIDTGIVSQSDGELHIFGPTDEKYHTVYKTPELVTYYPGEVLNYAELEGSEMRLKPEMEWLESPNKKEGRSADIEGIVIHSTEGSGTSALNTFENPESKASAHYVIMEDGRIHHMVDDGDTAWHAGPNANPSYIGIEIAGYAEKPGFSFTDAQYQSAALLVNHLMREHGIERESVVSHQWVSQNLGGTNHRDPGPNFDWAEFDSRLEILDVCR
ncbi:MAG: peptidoglycan recognition family protein [Candidatus Micrarchaeota archaeon]